MMIIETDIAVVGGGCSGVLVAVQLLRERFQGSVTIIESRHELGRGVAYSTRFEEHVLNVPASNMSALPDDPLHFSNWLRDRGFSGDSTRLFAPRWLYGEYLGELIQMEMLRSPRGAETRHVRSEVTAVRETPNGARLQMSDGNAIDARKVVLALGNPAQSQHLSALPAEVSDLIQPSPWIRDTLTLRFSNERILLLGSGLTAIDAMLAFLGQGPNSCVDMLSRRGILPRAHSVCRKDFDLPALPAHLCLTSIVRELRSQADRLEANGFCWRVAADALRPASNRIWSGLTLADQKRHLRHIKPFWVPHRHRMPPAINVRFHEYVRKERLNIFAGRVGRIVRGDSSIRVFLSSEDAANRVLDVHRIISCTGIQDDFTNSSRPLIRSMITEGTAIANDLGIGFRTDAYGALVQRGSSVSKTLFTLGPPRCGELLETTSVPEIRAQAKALAHHVIESCAPGNKHTELCSFKKRELQVG
jgi:uncharacterized NAD(P)/FAD-binding protein YdhS